MSTRQREQALIDHIEADDGTPHSPFTRVNRSHELTRPSAERVNLVSPPVALINPSGFYRLMAGLGKVTCGIGDA